MNKELVVTLNEDKLYPVVSMKTFMDLFELSCDTVKGLESAFKSIVVDHDTAALTIVVNGKCKDVTAEVDLRSMYADFCHDQDTKRQIEIEKQIEEIASLSVSVLRHVLKEAQKVLANESLDNMQLHELRNYDKIRNKLIAIPVNGDTFDKATYVYKEIADGIGYTARIVLDDDGETLKTVRITKEMAAAYGVSIEELMSTALARSVTMYSPTTNDISDALDHKGYWLSISDNSHYGAIVAAYPGVLKSISNKLHDDMIVFFVCTSSVLCMPKSSLSVEQIRDIMATIYSFVDEVVPESFLTDEIYLYNRSTDKLMKTKIM